MSNPNDNQMQDDLQFVMGDHRGRRFIWALLGMCGKGGNGMVIGAPDATAFNLGKLDVVAGIEAMMDLDQFVLMMKEAKELNENDDRKPTDTSPGL